MTHSNFLLSVCDTVYGLLSADQSDETREYITYPLELVKANFREVEINPSSKLIVDGKQLDVLTRKIGEETFVIDEIISANGSINIEASIKSTLLYTILSQQASYVEQDILSESMLTALSYNLLALQRADYRQLGVYLKNLFISKDSLRENAKSNDKTVFEDNFERKILDVKKSKQDISLIADIKSKLKKEYEQKHGDADFIGIDNYIISSFERRKGSLDEGLNLDVSVNKIDTAFISLVVDNNNELVDSGKLKGFETIIHKNGQIIIL